MITLEWFYYDMGRYNSPFLLVRLGQVLIMIDSISCGLGIVIKKMHTRPESMCINSVCAP